MSDLGEAAHNLTSVRCPKPDGHVDECPVCNAKRLLLWADAEIERLEKGNAQDDERFCATIDKMVVEIERQDAEIERLRTENERLRGEIREHLEKWLEADDEAT